MKSVEAGRGSVRGGCINRFGAKKTLSNERKRKYKQLSPVSRFEIFLGQIVKGKKNPERYIQARVRDYTVRGQSNVWRLPKY